MFFTNLEFLAGKIPLKRKLHHDTGMKACTLVAKKKEMGLLSQAENKDLSKDNDGRRAITK